MKTDRFFTVFLDQERKIIRMGEQYGADQIQILEGLEAVRKRPGMYIGSTSARGLHHLVYEIVDNAVDEALAGYCDSIEVTINPDNSITVVDDGRGIPVDIQKKAGLPAVEVVFTILHAGGKFGNGGYKVSGGLHGVGASVVNALSEWLEVKVYMDGNVYQQRYERGKVCYPLKIVGKCSPAEHGTSVTFLPDKEIFEETVYDYDTLKVRLRETAFLTKNLKITLKDEREEKKEKTFHYEGGIKEFVTYLNKKENLYKKMQEKIQNGASAIITQRIYDLDIAQELLQWCDKINQESSTNCTLIFGFFPITSYKTALFLHNKLPGVFIPQSWLETMEKASHNNTELEIGLEKSQRLFENLCKIQAKIHLMSSNKVDIIGKILNGR